MSTYSGQYWSCQSSRTQLRFTPAYTVASADSNVWSFRAESARRDTGEADDLLTATGPPHPSIAHRTTWVWAHAIKQRSPQDGTDCESEARTREGAHSESRRVTPLAAARNTSQAPCVRGAVWAGLPGQTTKAKVKSEGLNLKTYLSLVPRVR
jgi:hypothetical protein